MYPDNILFLERFPQGIDAHDSQTGRVQGVDAFMGGIGCMGGFADILYGLANKPVAGRSDSHRFLGHVGLGMHHHGHVDIVKVTFVNQLALAADIMKLALLPQCFAIGDLHIFFSRHGEEHRVPCQIFHDAGFHNAGAGRQHNGGLEEMAAGMGRPGQRICLGTIRSADGVQFRQHRYCRSRFPAFHAALYAGEGQSRLGIQSQVPHISFHFFRRFGFLETQLRFAFDAQRQLFNIRRRFVDSSADRSL